MENNLSQSKLDKESKRQKSEGSKIRPAINKNTAHPGSFHTQYMTGDWHHVFVIHLDWPDHEVVEVGDQRVEIVMAAIKIPMAIYFVFHQIDCPKSTAVENVHDDNV